MNIVLLLIAGLLVIGVVWFFWQRAGFSRLGAAKLDRVMALRAQGRPSQVPQELAAMQALGVNVPQQAVAMRITQHGAIRTSLDGPWKDFAAEQTIALGKPGFVWLAHAPLFAGQGVEVIDSYDGQAGLLQVRLLGALKLAGYEGPEADAAQLQRYLAELPMAPGSLARNDDLAYEARDDGSIRVWSKTKGKDVWVELVLDPAGRISERPGPRGGTGPLMAVTVMTPWGGTYSHWTLINGYEVPLGCEVWWLIDGKKLPYWRGQITGIVALDGAGQPLARK